MEIPEIERTYKIKLIYISEATYQALMQCAVREFRNIPDEAAWLLSCVTGKTQNPQEAEAAMQALGWQRIEETKNDEQ